MHIQVKRRKTWLKSLSKLKTVTRKYVIIEKAVAKTFTEYNPLTKELVPVYIEQVIGDPDANRIFFYGPKCRTWASPQFYILCWTQDKGITQQLSQQGRDAHRLCNAQNSEQKKPKD